MNEIKLIQIINELHVDSHERRKENPFLIVINRNAR